MHLTTRNVNTLFRDLVSGIHAGTIPTDVRPSRYGEVVRVEGPALLTVEKPRERVLFNSARDANCFFHLYEALFYLAGGKDVKPLAYYNRRMAEFSDDGVTLNDGYGYRWRNGPCLGKGADYPRGKVDQLDVLVSHLKANPWSRRAVLQMWNVEDDLLKLDSSRAVCCNTHAYFAVEPGTCRACEGRGKIEPWTDPACNTPGNVCPACEGLPHDVPRTLNMTVCNRSNDLVWGLCGANAVHFSVLQEYLAARLGLEVGVYHTLTNDLHAYTARWEPEEWLSYYSSVRDLFHPDFCKAPYDLYKPAEDWQPFPLVRNPAAFETELPRFVERHSGPGGLEGVDHHDEPFFRDVARPLCRAFHHHKRGEHGAALVSARGVAADDWRIAAEGWLGRRAERRKAKVK
jgi:thymidylate synthase